MTKVTFQYPPSMLEEAKELISIDKYLMKPNAKLEFRSSIKGVLRQLRSNYLLVNDPKMVSRKERAKYAFIHSENIEEILQMSGGFVQAHKRGNNNHKEEKKNFSKKR